ncbi:MAG TPA: phosphoenolpyruvate-utilizing N-terminal domain-containing protein, partial [Verrucomicrobiae bacterium]
MSGQVKGEKIYRGIPVSAGVCRGKVLVLHQARHVITHREMADDDVDGEVKRFEESLVRTRQQMIEVQRRVVENTSASTGDIFDPHLLMLEDRVVIDEVIRMIRQQKTNADFAFHTVTDRYIAAMAREKDEFFRERVDVLRDVTSRVLDNLLEVRDKSDLGHLKEPCILVGHDLSPSMTAQLDRKFVLGFVTDIGGKTSHTAILARSLDIPAIVGAQTISEELETGDYALLDGYNGTVIVNPTDQTLFEYGQLAKIKASLDVKLREVQNQPAVTLDGKTIHLSANIEDQHDIESVRAHGAEGVGLFRTEFLF